MSITSDDTMTKKRKSAGKPKPVTLKIETQSPFPKNKTHLKKQRVKSAANVSSAVVNSR